MRDVPRQSVVTMEHTISGGERLLRLA